MGGVAINAKTQVLRPGGAPIPGFYAAGEVTGGIHGRNRLGGNSISETITFGRIAGAEGVRYLRRG
jgi:fumarate reductase flavoprotein subunit